MATSNSVARGQITIVDLNDAKLVQVSLQCSNSSVQNYNPDTKLFSPSYTSSAPLVITPKVYQTGNSSEMIAGGHCSNYAYTIAGTKYTSATTDKTEYEVTTAGVLNVKTNLATAFVEIQFTCDFTDPETKQKTTLTADKTLAKTTSGGAVLSLRLEAAKGVIFDVANNTTTLTCVASVFRGGTQDKDNLAFVWQALDITTGTWTAVAASKVATASGVSTLSVVAADVLDFQTFRCVVTDSADKQTASDIITFEDKTDPYQIEVVSSTGDKIVNGTGSTTLSARVYQAGMLIESESTAAASQKFTYIWTKYDKNGTAANFNGTTAATKTGNPLVVLAADVDTRATFWCEVNEK